MERMELRSCAPTVAAAVATVMACGTHEAAPTPQPGTSTRSTTSTTSASSSASAARDAGAPDSGSPDAAASNLRKDSGAGGDAATGGTADSGMSGGKSAGCGLAPPQTGVFQLQTTDGAGTSRVYEVIVPANYDPATPLGVAFVYHGAGGSADGAASFGLQSAPDAAASAIFVFPQGIAFQSYGVGWDDTCSGYDMVFFDNMLAYLESHYCVDPSRVFAAGFSWGCDHVTALMCCRGDRIRAIGAASCSDEFADTSDYRTYQNLPCPSTGSTAVRFTHDVASDGAFTAQEFATTSQLYRALDSCTTSSSATASCTSYAGCAQPVVDCAYPNLGHALPATWASDTWAFFTSLR
jgi:poly(3-hydroxybutyrate) depolymerase